MKRFPVALMAAWLLVVMAHGQTPTPPPQPERPFTDALLDNLVGDWHVARKLGDGRTGENTLHVDWVLNHQFLLLHYRDIDSPPKYEAMVFIGFNNRSQRYVVHWIDVFGGRSSETLGYGTLDEAAHAIYFKFNYPENELMNTYAFDPVSRTWSSVMRQKPKTGGPWSLFAEDKITKR